jgi:hypothetical protein
LKKLVYIDEEDDEEDRLSVDDLMFEVGCYEKGNEIDSEDICILLDDLMLVLIENL